MSLDVVEAEVMADKLSLWHFKSTAGQSLVVAEYAIVMSQVL